LHHWRHVVLSFWVRDSYFFFFWVAEHRIVSCRARARGKAGFKQARRDRVGREER
jgi:hypothetical protein